MTDQEKAFSHLLTNEEIAQVITYLAATGLPVDLLINFGRKRLEFKRILPPKKLEGWQNRIQRYLSMETPHPLIRLTSVGRLEHGQS